MTKYGVFFAGLFLLVPAGAIIASMSRRARDLVFFSLVFSIIFALKYDINFLSREWYRGTTRGIEISFVDFLALVLFANALVGMLRARRRPFWPACLGVLLFFFAYCCVSVAVNEPKLFGLFGLSKIIRGIVIFLAVVYYVRGPREVYQFIYAQSAAMIYLGGYAIVQRYLLGDFRVSGTLPHPNILANYCAIVAPILLAVVLSNAPLRTRAIAGVAWAFAAIATILTISRMGSLAFVVVTLGVLAAGSTTNLEPRRVLLLLAIGVLGAGLFYRGWDKLEERNERDESFGAITTERGETGLRGFHYALGMMIAGERPMGLGLNNWSYGVSNHYGPLLGESHGVYRGTNEPPDGVPSVFAHTLIGLTLGELGWPGLLVLVVFWGRCLFLMVRFVRIRSHDVVSRVGIGCFFAFVGMLLSNLTECNFWFTHEFLMFHVVLALAVAASRRLSDRDKGGAVYLSADAQGFG